MRTHGKIIQIHAHMIQNVIEIGSFPVYRQSLYLRTDRRFRIQKLARLTVWSKMIGTGLLPITHME